ncbi:MAG: hypothetical protein WD607_10685 [Candidatus Paceibacterota bacterium]
MYLRKNIIKSIPGVTSFYRLLKSSSRIARRNYKRFTFDENLSRNELKISGWKNLFSGYYDNSPFQPENDKILLLHANQQSAWKKPTGKNLTSILLVDWQKQKVIRELGQTRAWNWQQGSRAIWINKKQIIFNDYDKSENKYISRLFSVEGEELLRLPIPLQAWDGVKGRIYSFKYEALTHFRSDYGYFNHKVNDYNFEDNKIESYSLESGKLETHVTVRNLIESTDFDRKKMRQLRLNHIMISPNGEKLIFLFRYQVEGRTVSDLYLLTINTGVLDCLLHDCGVSHYCWHNNNAVIMTMKGDNGFGYYKIDINTLRLDLLVLASDGHPSMLTNSIIITDSYPDKYAVRYLRAITLSGNNKINNLSAFTEPLLFHGVTRCDLHPSISKTGNWIQVDIASSHDRTVSIIKNPFSIR